MNEKAYQYHPRTYENFQYVYPVLSRRSHGISIGINLNPSKNCNYDCVYCQVDRTVIPEFNKQIDLELLKAELIEILDAIRDESLFQQSLFTSVQDIRLLTLKDIAFSGDGEPTLCSDFPACVDLVLSLISEHCEDWTPKVLPVCITNGTRLSLEKIKNACTRLIDAGGNLWVKLDAITREEFERVYDVGLSMEPVMEAIKQFSKTRSITIQTMIFKSLDGSMSLDFEGYIRHLQSMQRSNCKIQLIQIYTLSRKPKELTLKPLSQNELHGFANAVQNATRLPVEIFR